MNQHQRRIASAYPGLLPGFFTLAADTPASRPHLVRTCWLDPSEPPAPTVRRKGRRRVPLAYRRLFDDYLHECAAAVSVLFRFADIIHEGETIVVTTAISAADFDALAALGCELAEFENDDPMEDSDPPEDADADEDDAQDLDFGSLEQEPIP